MSRLLPSLPDATPEDREPRVVGVNDDADELIAALGSETAREILTRLHDEPATKSELADAVDTTLQTSSITSRSSTEPTSSMSSTRPTREGPRWTCTRPPTSHSYSSLAVLRSRTGSSRPRCGCSAATGSSGWRRSRPSGCSRCRDRPLACRGARAGGAGGDAATEDAADGPSIETVSEADGGGSGEIDGTVEYVVDPLADYAVSLLEPGSSSSSVPRSCSRSAGRTGTGAAADGARCRHTVPIASGCAHVGQLFMPAAATIRYGTRSRGRRGRSGLRTRRRRAGGHPVRARRVRPDLRQRRSGAIDRDGARRRTVRPAADARPLLVDILTEFGGAIDRVRVDDLRDGTFYAKVDAERYENGEPERFVFDAPLRRARDRRSDRLSDHRLRRGD